MIISPALTSSTPQYAKRRESGASLSNVITGTPLATAASIAGVTARASETDSMTPSIRSFTACAIRCACTCPSSCGGVSHSIRIGRRSDADSSRARFSAPMRAATNEGLLALFAIIAMRSGRSATAGAAGGAGRGARVVAITAAGGGDREKDSPQNRPNDRQHPFHWKPRPYSVPGIHERRKRGVPPAWVVGRAPC